MKEKIEKQLEFARQKQETAKYLDEREWRGYIKALTYVLEMFRDEQVRWEDKENI